MVNQSRINEFLWQGCSINTINLSHNVSNKMFLIIKAILFLYLQFCFVLNQVTWNQNWPKQFVYLTLWGFYLTYSYVSISMIYNSYLFYKQQKCPSYQPPFTFLPKFLNILFEVVFSIELTITVIYWGIVFPTLESVTLSEILNTSQFHGGMLIALWVDNSFNAIQFRKSHLVPLSIVSFLYCSVNCIYVLTTGEEIYPGLNWASLFSYIELLAAAALSLLHYFIGYFFYKKIKKVNILRKVSHINTVSVQQQCEEGEEERDRFQTFLKASLIQQSKLEEQEENHSIQQENYV